MSDERIDFVSLGMTLLNYHSVILPDILPAGKLVGKEWTCGDINGGAGKSFKFNVETGVFKDFSSNESGKDIIALYAKQRRMTMFDAAKELKEKYLAGSPVVKYNYPVKKYVDKQEIIQPPIDASNPPIPENSQSWCYRNAKGEPLFYIVRMQDRDTGDKFYYPLSFTNKSQWIKKHYPDPPLYNLHLLAKDLSKPVMVVEGEKAADAATKAQSTYIVVTWVSGANNWTKADWSPLQGRKVLLWPDADEPGKSVMASLSEHLLSDIGVKELKFVNTDKENGWDAHDAFVTERWTYAKFAEWAKPLVTVHVKKQKVEVIENEVESIRQPEQDITDLITTDDFPVSPNMQMKFIDLGLQFSDAKKTRLVMNASNVAKIMLADFKDICWYDSFYGKVFTKWRTGVERSWSDHDTNQLFIEMQHHYEIAKISKAHIQDAVEYVAMKNQKNEPQEWLKSLKWDGVSRVNDFFWEIMGAHNGSYSRAVSKNFWIGLVARIMQPACKLDEMVILEGKQGTYKTTSLEIIGGKWYGEVNCEITNKDFDQGLKGKIIVEFGELANLRSADIETIKRKLSTRIDEYRPSYGRYVEQHPRTCIFVGTTNSREYLKDPTGNRRFLPMEIQRVKTEQLKELREQYFAEALVRFQAGESWHEIPWEKAESIRAGRMIHDEWSDLIAEYMNKNSSLYITMDDVWTYLGNERGKFSKADQQRIAAILRQLGFIQKRMYIGQSRKTIWQPEGVAE